jgi:hypothetical membrane protein
MGPAPDGCSPDRSRWRRVVGPPGKVHDTMKYYRSISFVSSILLTLWYLTLSLLARLRYPLDYSPASNWLSDLGSRDLNPSGANFYDIGIVVTGLLLVCFFIGLTVLKIENNRVQNSMLLAAQAFGILGSLSMVMTGIFPIDQPSAHSFFGAGFRIATGTAFGFLVAALRYHEKCPRWLLVLGALTVLTDLMVSVFFGETYVLEWVVIALFLCNVLLVGMETRRLSVETASPPVAAT